MANCASVATPSDHERRANPHYELREALIKTVLDAAIVTSRIFKNILRVEVNRPTVSAWSCPFSDCPG